VRDVRVIGDTADDVLNQTHRDHDRHGP
jgi:hypothetical protein